MSAGITSHNCSSAGRTPAVPCSQPQQNMQAPVHVCTHKYTQVQPCKYTCLCTDIDIHTDMYAETQPYIHTPTHRDTHLHTRLYTNTHIHIHNTSTGTQRYADTHMYTQAHTHKHTYSYTLHAYTHRHIMWSTDISPTNNPPIGQYTSGQHHI